MYTANIIPNCMKLRKNFFESANELANHLNREETILFPYIRKMVSSKHSQLDMPRSPFGSVQNPIQVMMSEHEAEGVRFRKIDELSN